MVVPVAALLGAAAAAGLVRFIFRILTVGIISYVGGLAMVAAVQTLIANVVVGSLGPQAAAIIGLARLDEAMAIQLMFVNIKIGIAGLRKFKLL